MSFTVTALTSHNWKKRRNKPDTVMQCGSIELKYIMRVLKFHYQVRLKDFMVNKLNSWYGTDCVVTRI